MPSRTAARRRSSAHGDARSQWKREGGRLVRRAAASAPAPRVQDSARLAFELALERILAFLPPLEIIRSQLVCRAWRNAARSRAVWVAADLSRRSDFRVTVGMVRAVQAAHHGGGRAPAHVRRARAPVSPVRTRADATCRTQRELVPMLAAFAEAHGAPCRYLRVGSADVAAAVYDGDAGASDEASGSATPPPPITPVASAASTLQVLDVVYWAQPEEADELLLLFTQFSFPSLRDLTLSGLIDVEIATAVLRAAPALRYLCLDGAGLQVDAGAMLLAAPGLREAQLRAIDLGGPESTAHHMSYLERKEGATLDVESDTLQTLRVDSSKDLLFGAVRLPALRTLSLINLVPMAVRASNVGDATLLRITKSSPLLARLDVIGCCRVYQQLTSAMLAPLATQCPALEELFLRRTGATSDSEGDYIHSNGEQILRAPVFEFPCLRVLAARVADGITLRCPALQQLYLNTSNMQGGVESLLAGGASLRMLDVSRCSLSLAQLAQLADALPTLRQLTARYNCLSLEDANLFTQREPLHGQPGARLLCCMVQRSAGSYTLRVCFSQDSSSTARSPQGGCCLIVTEPSCCKHCLAVNDAQHAGMMPPRTACPCSTLCTQPHTKVHHGLVAAHSPPPSAPRTRRTDTVSMKLAAVALACLALFASCAMAQISLTIPGVVDPDVGGARAQTEMLPRAPRDADVPCARAMLTWLASAQRHSAVLRPRAVCRARSRWAATRLAAAPAATRLASATSSAAAGAS